MTSKLARMIMKRPAMVKGDFEKQIGIDEGKPKLQNQEQHPADEQSETGIDAEFKHVLFPK